MMSTRLRGISVFSILCVERAFRYTMIQHILSAQDQPEGRQCAAGSNRKIVWQNNAKYLHIINHKSIYIYSIYFRLGSMLDWRLIVLCKRWLKTQFHHHAHWTQVKWNCAENLATGSRILQARQSSILNIRNKEKETIIQYIQSTYTMNIHKSNPSLQVISPNQHSH